jgi:MFS family permease
LGAAFYGWLCDRATPLFALSMIAVCHTAAWLALAPQHDFPIIAVLVAVLGLGGGGLMPTLAALLGRIFTTQQFGSAFGQMNFATLPFTFAAAPLIGLGYDWLGNYRGAFFLQTLICAAAVALLVLTRSALRKSLTDARVDDLDKI